MDLWGKNLFSRKRVVKLAEATEGSGKKPVTRLFDIKISVVASKFIIPLAKIINIEVLKKCKIESKNNVPMRMLYAKKINLLNFSKVIFESIKYNVGKIKYKKGMMLNTNK